MNDPTAIIPEMEVYAADGVHVGSVDRNEGGRIYLNMVASSVAGGTGHGHYVEASSIERVEGNRIHLAVNGDDAVRPRAGEADDEHGRGAIEPPAASSRPADQSRARAAGTA